MAFDNDTAIVKGKEVKLTESDDNARLRKRRKQRMSGIIERNYRPEEYLGTVFDDDFKKRRDEEAGALDREDVLRIKSARWGTRKRTKKKILKAKKKQAESRDAAIRKIISENRKNEERKVGAVKMTLQAWENDVKTVRDHLASLEKKDNEGRIKVLSEIAEHLRFIRIYCDDTLWTKDRGKDKEEKKEEPDTTTPKPGSPEPVASTVTDKPTSPPSVSQSKTLESDTSASVDEDSVPPTTSDESVSDEVSSDLSESGDKLLHAEEESEDGTEKPTSPPSVSQSETLESDTSAPPKPIKQDEQTSKPLAQSVSEQTEKPAEKEKKKEFSQMTDEEKRELFGIGKEATARTVNGTMKKNTNCDEMAVHIWNIDEKYAQLLSDEAFKAGAGALLVPMRDALRGVRSRLKKVTDDALGRFEDIRIGSVLMRAMQTDFKDGFVPDYSLSREDKSKEHIFNLRYKKTRFVDYSEEDYNKLLNDAFGNDGSIVEALGGKIIASEKTGESKKESGTTETPSSEKKEHEDKKMVEGKGAEIIHSFVNELYLPYQHFRDYKRAGMMKDANDVYLGIVRRLVSRVPELGAYKVSFDNSLYYLILNFGENLTKGTARLHAEILGELDAEERESNEKTAEDLFDKDESLEDLYTDKSERELNAGLGAKGRYYKRSEIERIIKAYDVIVGTSLSEKCVKKLCRIEAMDSIVGFEREDDSLRFRLGQMFAGAHSSKSILGKGPEKQAKERILVLTDVVALGGPVYSGPRKKKEDESSEETVKISEKKKELPKIFVTEDMKEKLGKMDLKELKEKFHQTESDPLKDRFEPIFARVLLVKLSMIDDKDPKKRVEFLGDSIEVFKRYYRDLVGTVKPEEKKPDTSTETKKEAKPTQDAEHKTDKQPQTPSEKKSSTTEEQPVTVVSEQTVINIDDQKGWLITPENEAAAMDNPNTYAGRISAMLKKAFEESLSGRFVIEGKNEESVVLGAKTRYSDTESELALGMEKQAEK